MRALLLLQTLLLRTALGSASTSPALTSTPPPPDPLNCSSLSKPNPIANLYPDLPTGTINGTVLILPIPLSLARSIVPAEYPILEHVYRKLLPSFPKDQYPVIEDPPTLTGDLF